MVLVSAHVAVDVVDGLFRVLIHLGVAGVDGSSSVRFRSRIIGCRQPHAGERDVGQYTVIQLPNGQPFRFLQSRVDRLMFERGQIVLEEDVNLVRFEAAADDIGFFVAVHVGDFHVVYVMQRERGIIELESSPWTGGAAIGAGIDEDERIGFGFAA